MNDYKWLVYPKECESKYLKAVPNDSSTATKDIYLKESNTYLGILRTGLRVIDKSEEVSNFCCTIMYREIFIIASGLEKPEYSRYVFKKNIYIDLDRPRVSVELLDDLYNELVQRDLFNAGKFIR